MTRMAEVQIRCTLELGLLPLALDCIRTIITSEDRVELLVDVMALEALGEIQAMTQRARAELGIGRGWPIDFKVPTALLRTNRMQVWCEHVGGLGPPFPYCRICAVRADGAIGPHGRPEDVGPFCGANGRQCMRSTDDQTCLFAGHCMGTRPCL